MLESLPLILSLIPYPIGHRFGAPPVTMALSVPIAGWTENTPKGGPFTAIGVTVIPVISQKDPICQGSGCPPSMRWQSMTERPTALLEVGYAFNANLAVMGGAQLTKGSRPKGDIQAAWRFFMFDTYTTCPNKQDWWSSFELWSGGDNPCLRRRWDEDERERLDKENRLHEK